MPTLSLALVSSHLCPFVQRAAIALLVALRGSISIYQGEELGLPEAERPVPRAVLDIADEHILAGHAGVGDDGGFAPRLGANEDGLKVIVQAIEKVPGVASARAGVSGDGLTKIDVILQDRSGSAGAERAVAVRVD